MNGVIYVAFGASAEREAAASIETLKKTNPSLPVAVVCEGKTHTNGVTRIPFDRPGNGARRAKLNVDRLAPQEWGAFLYLDADTRVRQDVSAGFSIVEDGWDVVITASDHQVGNGLMWHVGEQEREATVEALGNFWPLALQGGLMFVARNERTAALFEAWREEWERWGDQDQAALLRALHRVPVRVWLLGRCWNGGAIVEHRFGRAKG